jgi:hypothetical protein
MASPELSKEIKPDLYPDIVAAGSLAKALAQAFAELGSPLQPESLINFLVFARTERGSRFCQMYIAAHERLFLFDFWFRGVGYGNGSTSSLHDAAQAIHFWLIEQPNLTRMQDCFSFFTADKKGLAHEAGRAVEYQWETLRANWARQYKPGSLSPLPLIDAAMEQPELRQLFPFTSLYTLHFSRTTGFPFTLDCPYAAPIGNNRFRAYKASSRALNPDATGEMIGEGNAAAVISMLVAHLPPDCGAAVEGTANDPEEHP